MMDEDTADSRTLGVGRKRDLQDATQSQDGEPARDYDSSDEEQQRSRKRAKQSQKPSNATGSDDGIFINTASPWRLPEPLSGQVPVDDSSSHGQDDSIPASEANVDSGDAPVEALVASSEVELPHASPTVRTEASRSIDGVPPATFDNGRGDAQARASGDPIIPTASTSAGLDAKISPLPGWNGGIQSGLRTSFSAKSRIASTKPVSSFQQSSNKLATVPLGGTRSPSNVEKTAASSEDDIEDSTNNSSGAGNSALAQAKGIEVGAASYVPLTKYEKALLPVAEQQAHTAAYRAMMKEQKLQTWDKHTMQAEKALAQEKTWPISNGPMLDMINHGKTYYARDVAKPLKFSNNIATFDVSPVWDEEGKPIKAQDFSFNRFAPAFIKENLEKAAYLNMDDLLSAFHKYCKNGFYRHLGAKCQPLMDTVNAEDVLSLEEAIKLARVYASHPVTESDIEMAGMPSSAEGSSQNETPIATAPTSSSDSFVVLSKKARGKLTPSELAAYEEKLKEKSVRAATEEADRVIRLVGRWPLPKEYASVSDSISKGNTFYARPPKNPKHYTKGGVEYQIDEIYGEGGIPLKAEDFSFNMFVVAFLRQNSSQKKRNTITIKHLHGAFGFYCSKFYNPVSQPIVMQTTRAPDALTLEQAMELVSPASNSQATVERPIERAPREDSPRLATESASLANTFVQEVESQISQYQKSSRAGDTNTTQSSSSVLGHGSRMVTLKQLANGANQVQPPKPSSVSLAATASNQSKDVSQPLSVLATNDNDTPMNDAMPLPSRHVNKGKSAGGEVVECMDDVFLQQKYFPSSENISDRCLACAKTGHGSNACPALQCTLCGMSGDHSNFTCPQNTRCQKCRQHDHQTSACPEKLLLSNSEAIPCDICGSKEHLEIGCHFIWRSFAPGPEVRKVQDIPVHCYTCGGEGHYGSECGILTRPLRSGKSTWSRSNAQKYINPISADRALSAGIDYSIPKPTKQFSIKGMGGVGNPYTIDDSEEEGEFIRPKINNVQDRGHIRFGETSRGNYPPPNDSYRPIDSRRGPAMGFNGAYDEDHASFQMPYRGPSSYQQSTYNYNPGGQYPGQPASFGRGSHDSRMNRDHQPPVQNRYPTRQATATAAVTNNKPKTRKKKDKKAKDKKRSGNGN